MRHAYLYTLIAAFFTISPAAHSQPNASDPCPDSTMDWALSDLIGALGDVVAEPVGNNGRIAEGTFWSRPAPIEIDCANSPSNLVFRLTPRAAATGEADLYVRRDSAPTNTNFTQRSWEWGNAEVITIADPCAGRTTGTQRYFVGVDAYTELQNGSAAGDASGIDLSATWDETTTPPPSGLDIEVGALSIPDRATFETLAFQNTTPGALALREVKFLITDVQGTPKFYFINSKNFPFHYAFATRREADPPRFPTELVGLDLPISLRAFNAQTYFSPTRNFIAGKIVAHDHHEVGPGVTGSYVIEFWPTDNPNAELVKLAYDHAKAGLGAVGDGRFFYHPTGDVQKETLADAVRNDPAFLRDASVTDEELFGDIAYSPATIAEGAGLLRELDGGPPPSFLDVVIMDQPAGDLPRVGGAIVMGSIPTALDHVSIISKGAPPDNPPFPYAYIKEATTHPDIQPLVGKWVLFKVGPNGFEITETDEQTVRDFHEDRRPAIVTRPPWDPSATEIVNINDIGRANAVAYGSKAANAGQLRKIRGRVFSVPGDRNLPTNGGTVTDAFAVPHTFYHDFMNVQRNEDGSIAAPGAPDTKSLFEIAAEMMDSGNTNWSVRPGSARWPNIPGDFNNDSTVRQARLEQFKDFMDRGGTEMPESLQDKVDAVFDGSGGRWRVRSSASYEDLEKFSGAGLHDSTSEDADRIRRGMQEVFASMWNYRAFNAREFSRIDHFESKMGLLIHRNFPEEVTNFVAVTINPDLPGFPGFSLNIAPQDALVTAGANADRVSLAQIPPNRDYTPIYHRNTTLRNLVRPGQDHVMTREELQVVAQGLQQIHDAFAPLYNKSPDDPKYAMDVEGKLVRDRNGRLTVVMKQARPYQVPDSGR